MQKRAPLIVLALALLVLLAFLVHRAPREQKPTRTEPRAVSIATPEPAAPVAPAPIKPATAPVAPPPEPPPAQGPPGTVRGNVKIAGDIPPRKRARLESDPKCQAMHAGVVMFDHLVADAAGNVQWAFVQVKSGPIGTPPPAPTTTVLLDQIRCVFTPHMVGVRVGQPVRVRSSDDTLHNVHGLPFLNREFNVGLPVPGELVRTFTTPEVFVIKCDVHPWMRACVGVVDHPFWAITNELGSYVIRDLPPGKFTLEVWHEQYRPVTRELVVPPGGDVALDFVLDVKRD
jgi:plastocyanin